MKKNKIQSHKEDQKKSSAAQKVSAEKQHDSRGEDLVNVAVAAAHDSKSLLKLKSLKQATHDHGDQDVIDHLQGGCPDIVLCLHIFLSDS